MESLQNMNRTYYESGTDVEDYLRDLRTYRSFVQKLAQEATATDEGVQALVAALKPRQTPVVASIFTEPWCGDSACNLPILRSLFQQAAIPLRVFDRARHGELQKRYHDEGVDHIPVVSLWDAQGDEVARWIEAPAAIAPLKDEWKQQHPRMMELYAIKEGNREAENEFARLYRSFMEDMAVWYREGMWDETIREIVELTGKPR
ncbi:MAG: thioredoxin family protein [Spirochaetales bacterium]|nr:thioredoxin family protein [Spirochaetales bacterium]